MTLRYQPEFDAIRPRFQAFWEDEAPDRPLVCAQVPRDPARPLPLDEHPATRRYLYAVRGKWAEQFERIDRWLEQTHFLGEAIPSFSPDFGPDQFAAFLGATLEFSESNPDTNWVEPVVGSLPGYVPVLNDANPAWRGVRNYARALSEHARGRYLVGVCDLHSNLDALSALRGPENLCLDLADDPDEAARVSGAIRGLYRPVYEGLFTASGFDAETGTLGWTPFWTDGRFAVVQCDYSCMIGRDDFRRFVLPGIREEAAMLDRCMYHLDGPGALRHLDDILDVPDIDVLQWVPGAGQPPIWEWMEVLKRGLAAGKRLHIHGLGPDAARAVHAELRSRRCLYEIHASDAREVERLLVDLR